MSAGEPIRIEVGEEGSGERLDRFLAAALELPRNRVQRWIRDGHVRLEQGEVKSSRLLAEGEWIECRPPPAEPDEKALRPEPGPLEVLWEDEHLVALDKPARLAMHPGAGRREGTLAHRALARYAGIARVGHPGRPGIVHRLDIDTTGVVVLALSDVAYTRLSRAFAERRVEKTYLGVCHGAPSPAAGRIERPIGRHPTRRKEMTVRERGRRAVTGYRLLAAVGGAALLRLDLETGRTHQIRVHLKALGHPLVGDPVYGEARWRGLEGVVRGLLRDFERPALHAWRLALEHPVGGERLSFEAPPPADLTELWRALGGGDVAATAAADPA